MTPPTLRPIEIVGGGLAGLALGLALRQREVPVTLHEAGDYPRHRVCGEFMAGLREDTITRLGLEHILGDAKRHWDVAWFAGDRPSGTQRLPEAALALSRHALDQRLAQAFVRLGGELRTRSRVSDEATGPGRVSALGRRESGSAWMGLKVHVRDLALASELELHLGDHAYVGLCAVENGRVNVCGLFRRRPGLAAPREEMLLTYLRACGLGRLAARLGAAALCVEACVAVAGVGFDAKPRKIRNPHAVAIGDAFAMIPPFTGNGMAMAFESADSALDPLTAWSRGTLEWSTAARMIRGTLQRRFRTRLASAALLHPFLFSPTRQRWLATAHRAGLVPARPLYHLLH